MKMNKIRLLSVFSMGIFASASGSIQVQAVNYNFFTDFSTKEVANFDAFEPVFTESTNSLTNAYNWSIRFNYVFDTCPTPNTPLNVDLRLYYRIGNSAPLQTHTQGLPDLPCSTTTSFYSIQIFRDFTIPYLDTITTPDDNFVQFWPLFRITQSSNYNGRTLTIFDPLYTFNFIYDFGTTYMFSHFLSDSRYESIYNFGFSTFGSVQTWLDFVYTTAGADQYVINNTNTTSIGTTRKKYAINYEDETFRGESIGLEYEVKFNGTVQRTLTASGAAEIGPVLDYYYFNASNNQTAIVDVPTFEFETEDCGSFLGLNVACFINNGLAYVVNDAPIISDAFTLLNAGIKLGGQAFGIIGEFTTDNVFGVLVLGGLGITAVRWFLKQD
jgi:hypothetical protein